MTKEEKILSITESSDFHCLLELMLPLYKVDGFAWLPELFSIIGHEKLLLLSKYAGGETIKIPTLDQLTTSILSLQMFYDVYIAKRKSASHIPPELKPEVLKILEVYNARDDSERDSEPTTE